MRQYRAEIADSLAAENHLSFIETSALDASNVESAFQNILTGKLFQLLLFIITEAHIIRLVSKKSTA